MMEQASGLPTEPGQRGALRAEVALNQRQIKTTQVWSLLSLAQQQRLRQIIALISRDLVQSPALSAGQEEGRHESV